MSFPPQTVSLSDGRGVVVSFDDPRGIGIGLREDGTEYPFHCTGILDGTRTITVGEAVTFRVVAGRNGKWEAASIVRVADAQAQA